MKQEINSFILKYYALMENAGFNIDHKIYDYDSACNNDGNFIDYIGGAYKYGACERGNCEVIFESTNLEDCMYFPIRIVIHNLAFEYELKNRVQHLDARILGFGMMLYYMNNFQNDKWNRKLYSELLLIIQMDKLDKKMILKISQRGGCIPD